jgi:aminomethyltransferase
MTRKTPLHAQHRPLGARMVEFAGWEMPLSYGSQIEEHHAVRREAGLFDIGHMGIVDLSGPDCERFLSRLLANDVARLREPGRALYSCLLNGSGGILDDLILYRLGDSFYRLVINAASADKDRGWIAECLKAWAFELSMVNREDLTLIALQGPRARSALWRVRPEWRLRGADLKPFHAVSFGETLLACTGYTGEDGFELMVPVSEAEPLWSELLAAGVSPCGLGARDTLRLEAGLCLYGQEMDESVSPFDCGLGWTVAMADERDFVGRSALLAQGRGAAFLGLILEDRGILRAHQKVHTPMGEGVTTSGGFSPTLQRSIALARLPWAVTPGEGVEVIIRERLCRARTVRPPFVRHGKIAF